jgi:ABC-2 type transport system ATP-binding protein
MSDAIDFNQVSKRFGNTSALRSVSFGVPAGCIYGLIGLNGAGKTTLIKCLLDFTFPDSGDIRIFSVPATQSRARGPLA